MPFTGTDNQLGTRFGIAERGATVLVQSIPVLGGSEVASQSIQGYLIDDAGDFLVTDAGDRFVYAQKN